ncbi:MAG: shikimate dehydrogenase [Acidobacteria bacterium]|nr:shikimate dehydrogenase [Acidobacteriota bacterium]
MRRMYFIGVTTGESSIHRIFPRWARLAGVEDAELVGADLPLGGPPAGYRAAVARVRDDPEAMGALVTTHKVPIFEYARDLFTDFDADAELLGEVSCIVRRGERLTGQAIDTLTAGLALRAILGETKFCGHALVMGAGGGGLAFACHLYREHQPAQVILTDISAERLAQVRGRTPAHCELVSGPEAHDRMIGELPPGSLIVNATGVGKDRPGSPITAAARFPVDTTAWDFNYRGELLFLDYARAQQIRTIDGWEYFLHGWSQIMARVLGFDLTPELFAAMKKTAEMLRR